MRRQHVPLRALKRGATPAFTRCARAAYGPHVLRRTALSPLLLAFAVLSLAACNRAPAGPVMEPLTQAYSTQNGLVTAHFPAAFAASPGSASRLQLNRTLPVEMSASLSAFETPVSNDLGEFARVGIAGMTATMQGYQELGRGLGTCNGVPGVQVRGTFQSRTGTPLYWNACALLRNGHGYIFFYLVPQSDAATWAPLLQSILDATAFNR